MPWWACRVTRRERERDKPWLQYKHRCIIIIVYSKPGSLPRKRWVSRKDVFEQYGPSGRSSSQGVKNLGCRVRSASCCSRRLWLSSYDPQIHVEQSWTATNSMDCHEINHKTTDHDSELWKTPRRFYYTRILPPLSTINIKFDSDKFKVPTVTSHKHQGIHVVNPASSIAWAKKQRRTTTTQGQLWATSFIWLRLLMTHSFTSHYSHAC